MGVAETAKPRNCATQILARKRFPPNILARLDLGVGNHSVKKIMGTSLFCRKLSSFKPNWVNKRPEQKYRKTTHVFDFIGIGVARVGGRLPCDKCWLAAPRITPSDSRLALGGADIPCCGRIGI